jgi:MFS family permease
MNAPLRPLSTGELLDRTFTLYRQNFWLFIGVTLLAPVLSVLTAVVLLVLGIGTAGAAGFVRNPWAIGSTVTFSVIVFLIGHAIALAASIRAVAARYLDRPITIGEAYASIRGHLGRVLGAVILSMIIVGFVVYALLIAGVVVVALGVTVISGTSGKWIGGAVGVVVLICCLLAAFRFAMRYVLTVQACVVEDLGATDSMKRSRLLTSGSYSRIVTVYFVCIIIAAVLGAVGQGLATVLTTGGTFLVRQSVVQLFSLITSALTAPIATVAMCLVYYDERVRKEAFDLQLLMETLDGPAGTAAETAPGPALG